jgi:hypothetical protein
MSTHDVLSWAVDRNTDRGKSGMVTTTVRSELRATIGRIPSSSPEAPWGW